MNCPNCQASVAEGALLCPNCGYHVATAYQRGKVNELISDRPGVVRRSFRSGGFVFLAILMSIISLAALVQMVLTIKESVVVFEAVLERMEQIGTHPEWIGILIGVSVVGIISILTFALALTSAISNWQNVCSDNNGLQVNHLSSMGSYLGLQRVWAVIAAVILIFSVVLVAVCGLIAGEFGSELGGEIAATLEGMGIDSVESIESFEKFMKEDIAVFAVVMLVIGILVTWLSIAHVCVLGKSLTSLKRMIGVLDPTSYKGREWNLKRRTPMVGPCFFGFLYMLSGVMSLLSLESSAASMEELGELVGTEMSASTISVMGAIASVVLGVYLIVFAVYVRSVRKALLAHERRLHVEQQNLATVESNTAMEIRNIRISQEHQQRQDEERRRQEEIRRRAEEEEQRRMIRLAQEEQQQMMQQLMLSMTATHISAQKAESSAATMTTEVEPSVVEEDALYAAPAPEELAMDAEPETEQVEAEAEETEQPEAEEAEQAQEASDEE